MAGTLLDRHVIRDPKGQVRFSLAQPSDDADLRRLLRDNPTHGQISLSLEREPDYFADAHVPGEEKRTIVARDQGRAACMGSCTVRQRYINGQPRRVGYLAGLRLDAAFAGRFDIVRRGYSFFEELESPRPADFYFTSIAADNERARRFLERGMSGMPLYEFLGEFVTVVLPVSSAKTSSPGHCPIRSGERCFLEANECNRHYQLSPSWSQEEVQHLERLGLERPVALKSDGRIIASAALWDQRCFKQTVIQGYAPALAFARPAINLAAMLFRQPRLPVPKATLKNVLVTQLAVAAEHPGAFIDLIKALRQIAWQRGFEFLTLGLAEPDPRLSIVRSHLRRREYQTRLYLVRWPRFGGSAAELDHRLPAPEVALL